MLIFMAILFGAVAGQTYVDPVPRCYQGLCQQLCLDTVNGYQCRCLAGFYVNPANTRACIPVQGCPVPNRCEQLCFREGNSYRCGCRNGFYLDPQNRFSCLAMYPVNPPVITTTCGPGYTVDPASPNGCKDIDECLTRSRCQHKCDNLPGNYRCTCNTGFVVSAEDNTKCKGFQLCTAAVDVILVVDSTDGMGYNNFQLLLSFVSEISQHFQIGPKRARFGALLFSDAVQLLFGLDDYKTSERISTEILAAPYLGGNSINFEVFDYIRKKDLFNIESGGRPHVHDTVIVFTDGRSSTVDLTRAAAENLKNTGVTIVVVGIGNGVSASELASVASTREHVLLVPDFYHIENIQEKLVRLTCPEIDD